MSKPEKIWGEQCETAKKIQYSFGTGKALGYLIGEKLLNFIVAGNVNEEFARELPALSTR